MDSTKMITLVLADDHGIVREGIAAICATRPDLLIIGQSADGAEAVEMILALKPDFALLDLNMPKFSGVDVIRRVRQAKSQTRLLILSISRDNDVIREVFRLGGDGYILKDGPPRHIFDAINYVRDGGQYLTPLIRRETIDNKQEGANPLSLLSKREYEVFGFLVDGMRAKDIAKLLELSPKTVDTYRAGIMRKLEVDGIAGLVRFAIRCNLQPNASDAGIPC